MCGGGGSLRCGYVLMLRTLICCVVCTCEFLRPCLLVHVCLPTCACCASLNIHVCVFDLAFPTVCVTGVFIYSISTYQLSFSSEL